MTTRTNNCPATGDKCKTPHICAYDCDKAGWDEPPFDNEKTELELFSEAVSWVLDHRWHIVSVVVGVVGLIGYFIWSFKWLTPTL